MLPGVTSAARNGLLASAVGAGALVAVTVLAALRAERPTPGVYAPVGFDASQLALPARSSTGPVSIALEGEPLPPHEFYFTRAVYSEYRRGRFGFGGGSWAIDYPKADRQFIVVVKRLANLDAYDFENAVSLADPEVRRFPFLYMLEVGDMYLTDEELRGLRDYLAAGGFLMIDDTWDVNEWENLEAEMARVLPGRPIVDLPMDHQIFRSFYNIEHILQVPNISRATSISQMNIPEEYERRFTSECYYSECEPTVKGIFDDQGRLMVIIHHNTDLGDAWEWAENPYYPLKFSTYAYEVGVNMIIYSMTQ